MCAKHTRRVQNGLKKGCGVVWIGCIYVQPTGAAALGLLGCSFVHTVQSLWTKLRGLFFCWADRKAFFFSIAFYFCSCLRTACHAGSSAICDHHRHCRAAGGCTNTLMIRSFAVSVPRACIASNHSLARAKISEGECDDSSGTAACPGPLCYMLLQVFAEGRCIRSTAQRA